MLKETIKTDTEINLLIARSLVQRGYKKIGVLGIVSSNLNDIVLGNNI